jgi:hypothetical protein
MNGAQERNDITIARTPRVFVRYMEIVACGFYTYALPGPPLNVVCGYPGSFMQVIFCLKIFF